MVVRVRAPRQAMLRARRGHLHRALHRPEMRVGQRDVHGLELQGVLQLAPIRRDHVRRGAQAGGPAELRHDLAAGEAALGAARVLGVGQRVLEVAADADGLGERPGAVGVEGDARLREALRQRLDRGGLLVGRQHAALELEILETEALLRRLRLAHNRLRGQRFLVAQPMPGHGGGRLVPVGQGRLATIGDVEKVAEHLDLGPELSAAEQGRDRHAAFLTQQVEQGRFDRRHRVDRRTQVERLQTAPARIAVGEGLPDARHQLGPAVDRLADEQFGGVEDGLADLLAARHLAQAGPAGAVPDEDDVAGEERAMRAAEVEQHAVVAGDRHDAEGLDRRDGHRERVRRGGSGRGARARRSAVRRRPDRGGPTSRHRCSP